MVSIQCYLGQGGRGVQLQTTAVNVIQPIFNLGVSIMSFTYDLCSRGGYDSTPVLNRAETKYQTRPNIIIIILGRGMNGNLYLISGQQSLMLTSFERFVMIQTITSEICNKKCFVQRLQGCQQSHILTNNTNSNDTLRR